MVKKIISLRRIKIINLFTNPYSIAQLVSIEFQQHWDYVETVLKRCARLFLRSFNVVQGCFDVVSTSGSDVVSTFCIVEKPTSDFVSFSMSNQCYFNVDPQP